MVTYRVLLPLPYALTKKTYWPDLGAVKTPVPGLYPLPSLSITTGNAIVLPLPIFPAPDVPAVKATFFEESIEKKSIDRDNPYILCPNVSKIYKMNDDKK